jgi:hypothetical protein
MLRNKHREIPRKHTLISSNNQCRAKSPEQLDHRREKRRKSLEKRDPRQQSSEMGMMRMKKTKMMKRWKIDREEESSILTCRRPSQSLLKKRSNRCKIRRMMFKKKNKRVQLVEESD